MEILYSLPSPGVEVLCINSIFFCPLVSDLPGWPLLSPLKIPMQKCDKCNREFFSSINYRRHIRVHHRLRKLDKVEVFFFKKKSDKVELLMQILLL